MLRNVLRLFWVSPLFLLLVAACAPKKVEIPTVVVGDITEALAEKRSATDIESTFSIAFEKADSVIRGDGALTISKSGDLDLRVYSLGFLAMELTARDGTVKSSPRLDRAKTLMLTEGLKDCVFWWNMDSLTIDEDGDMYILKDPVRTVWVDKKNFLPVRQVVYLEDGKELKISYEDPVRENNLWYKSKIRLEYSRYAVVLSVKTLAAGPPERPCYYCSL